ncbi:RNA polymerase sigma factor [Carboxylicivirga linearis]|uniref:Sigma-70 family RNA polymerase sigma factor n=1 Tax=Carboxylicivirga linearis TaxID=1628157 RepID=A0ABS5K1N9_9BACT|nr:sigma-70 family RNA polymerase sigma factor [Carboxylicivirga linearis]MBS2101062.1 sigma-70 family RNA polymerase sigma factor [Carboxylicivirga linearis]
MGKLRYTNNELLEGVYSRDSRVIKYIMGLVWVPVRDLVIQNSGKEDDAMNLIQEGFIAIYTKTEKPQLTASFATYFYAICRNIWLNELRIRKKESSMLSSIESAPVMAEEVDEEQLYEKRRQLYLKHFKKITKVCQDILKMVSNGFSNEDITAELAFSSVQYMKNRRTVCNKKLMDMIKEDPQYKELKYGL